MSIIAEVPTATKERWRTAGRFADVLEAEVKSRRLPMGARVVSWFNLCRICQDLEEQMLLAGPAADDDRQLHRALLSTAIASGEGLLIEAEDSETLRALGFTMDSLRAKVESLHITFEQWHTTLHPERQAAILAEAFGGKTGRLPRTAARTGGRSDRGNEADTPGITVGPAGSLQGIQAGATARRAPTAVGVNWLNERVQSH